MSLTYALYIDAPPAEPRSVISRFCVVDADGDWALEGGLQGTVREIPSEEWTVAEDAGVEPRCVVRFRLDKHQDLDVQQLNVLRVVLSILREVSGNAVLLFNGEDVWLQRDEGQLVLNNQLWNQNRLALVSVPYELRVISSL